MNFVNDFFLGFLRRASGNIFRGKCFLRVFFDGLRGRFVGRERNRFGIRGFLSFFFLSFLFGFVAQGLYFFCKGAAPLTRCRAKRFPVFVRHVGKMFAQDEEGFFEFLSRNVRVGRLLLNIQMSVARRFRG